MPVRFRCPGCDGRLSTAARKAGTRATCPRCGASLVVPGGVDDRTMAAPDAVPTDREPRGIAEPPAEAAPVPLSAGVSRSLPPKSYFVGVWAAWMPGVFNERLRLLSNGTAVVRQTRRVDRPFGSRTAMLIQMTGVWDVVDRCLVITVTGSNHFPFKTVGQQAVLEIVSVAADEFVVVDAAGVRVRYWRPTQVDRVADDTTFEG